MSQYVRYWSHSMHLSNFKGIYLKLSTQLQKTDHGDKKIILNSIRKFRGK